LRRSGGSLLILAHRGASGYAPENTLEAVRLALDLGADGVEIDVRQVSGKLLVVHDADLRRWGGPRRPLRYLGWQRIRNYLADGGRRHGIPLLQQVLDLLQPHPTALVNIEVKERRAFRAVGRLLLDHYPHMLRAGRFLISAFDLRGLRRFHREYPQVPVGCLAARRLPRSLRAALRMPAASWHIPLDRCRTELVRRAHAAGLAVLVFTVNTAEALSHALSCGVDGVFTDYPDHIRKLLTSRRTAPPSAP